MTIWYNTLAITPPLDTPLLLSNGVNWCQGLYNENGSFQRSDNAIEAVYWAVVNLPPIPAYVTADGATIIRITGGLELTLDLVVQEGDELWSDTISELTDSKSAYLTFGKSEGQAVWFTKPPVKKPYLTDWLWIRNLIYNLGENSCYLRRVYGKSK